MPLYRAYLVEELAFVKLGLQRCIRLRERLASAVDHIGGNTFVVYEEIDMDGSRENMEWVVTEVFLDGIVPGGNFNLDEWDISAETVGTIMMGFPDLAPLTV